MVLKECDVHSGELRPARKSALTLWASEDQRRRKSEKKSKGQDISDSSSQNLHQLSASKRLSAKNGKSAAAGQKARARSSPAVPGSKPKAHKGQKVRFSGPIRKLCR